MSLNSFSTVNELKNEESTKSLQQFLEKQDWNVIQSKTAREKLRIYFNIAILHDFTRLFPQKPQKQPLPTKTDISHYNNKFQQKH